MSPPNEFGCLPSPHDPARGAGPGGTDQGDVNLGRAWIGVAAEVWRRQPGRAERTAARLLRSPGLARALLTTPSLLLPGLIATVVVFGAGALVRLGPGQPLVGLVAPAVAAVGIAFAYGPGVDPAWELAASCAVSERMVLLTRAVAVFALDAGLGLVASAASGAAAALTFDWLLPMTAVSTLALAVAVTTRSAVTGAGAGVAAWVISVLAGQSAGGQLLTSVTSAAAYLPYLAVAACAAALVSYTIRPQRTLQ
jgi:hypothetical protein